MHVSPADKHSAKERVGRMSKVKNCLLCIPVVLSVLILCGIVAWLLFGAWIETTYSCSEFNAELTNGMSRQYGIFIPDTAGFVEGKYEDSFKNSNLTVVFDIRADDADDLHQIFHEQLWSWDDIETAWKSQVGEDTDIRGVYPDTFKYDDPTTHYPETHYDENFITDCYEAYVTITKTSVDTYRVDFTGYGLISRFFKDD